MTDPPGIGCHLDQGRDLRIARAWPSDLTADLGEPAFKTSKHIPVSFLGIERNVLAFDKIAAAMRALEFLGDPLPFRVQPAAPNRLTACKSKQFLVRRTPCDIRPDYRENLKCNLCRRFIFGCDGQFVRQRRTKREHLFPFHVVPDRKDYAATNDLRCYQAL